VTVVRTEAEWLEAIRADPGSYQLLAYGWMTPDRAAGYFARWQADERDGVTGPALCRACGSLLKFPDTPSDQIHAWCRPIGWDH
jgi:hypothetical protein